MGAAVGLYVGEGLARYGFPDGHPFSCNRQGAFLREANRRGLDKSVKVCEPRLADAPALCGFHAEDHVERVRAFSRLGSGYLDADTPAFPGVFEAASAVAGSAVEGLDQVMSGAMTRTFQPIGGMHHARRDGSAGFCVFNDLGMVIDRVRRHWGVDRVGYVDIDVHHGDGVFYTYESDPGVVVADVHEDGRFLYPGTGEMVETGSGAAEGTKLNRPLPPGGQDPHFYRAWDDVMAHLHEQAPEFIVFQCGADGLAGDPLAHLNLTPSTHRRATRDLCRFANEHCQGHIMAFGGGGYHLGNVASAWCTVLEEMSRADWL